jgi:(p)ppGpp synthase/HD superfamily hydrolase
MQRIVMPQQSENTMDIVAQAKELAYRAHAGQVDKAGRPYIEHVARVAARVADDPQAEAVAWLHDVLEDAPESERNWYGHHVEDSFPEGIVEAVIALTRTFGYPADVYYADILENPLALRVKLADIADNADEARLALLDETTAARLRRKYAKALAALGHNA